MLSGDFFCLKLAHAGYVPYICNIKHREIEQSVARRAHNPKVAGSSPALATKIKQPLVFQVVVFYFLPYLPDIEQNVPSFDVSCFVLKSFSYMIVFENIRFTLHLMN